MDSTKKQLLSGVFYTAISKYSGLLVSLIVAAILARVLSPEDFGIVAIATVIIAFFGFFTDLGIAPAIVQKKELTNKDLSSIFSFTIWAGIIISSLFFLASWPIASYYNNHTLKSICQWLSLDLFFASANIVPNAILFKNKEFKYLAIRSIIVQAIGAIASVCAALMGAGLYALVINPILSSFLLFLIAFKKYPQKLRFDFGISSMKKIFSFTMYQFFFDVINYFSRNLDKLLIGKYLGLSPLGYYEKSYRLMMLPLQNITHVISPVIHPIFSDYQNDFNKLATSYEKIIRFLAFISFPLSVLLFFCAREITLIIFGPQWIPSVPIFQILSITIGTQIILSTSGSIFQSSNDTRSLFICGLFSSCLNILGLFICIFILKSLQAVAWGILITYTINFFQCYWWMYKVTFKLSMKHFWLQYISPLILSCILCIILFFIDTTTNNSNIFFSVIIKGCTFLLIFVTYIQLTKEFDIMKKMREKVKVTSLS